MADKSKKSMKPLRREGKFRKDMKRAEKRGWDLDKLFAILALLSRLKDALPELVHLMKPPKDVLVKTSIGFDAVRAFRRLAIDELKRGDTLLIIGGSSERFYDVMGSEYKEIEEKRIKKKIYKKLVAFSSERERFDKDPYRAHSVFRYFSSSHPTTSSINIFGHNVGIIIWATEPILLHIRNEDVATSYRHYFEELWKASVA